MPCRRTVRSAHLHLRRAGSAFGTARSGKQRVAIMRVIAYISGAKFSVDVEGQAASVRSRFSCASGAWSHRLCTTARQGRRTRVTESAHRRPPLSRSAVGPGRGCCRRHPNGQPWLSSIHPMQTCRAVRRLCCRGNNCNRPANVRSAVVQRCHCGSEEVQL